MSHNKTPPIPPKAINNEVAEPQNWLKEITRVLVFSIDAWWMFKNGRICHRQKFTTDTYRYYQFPQISNARYWSRKIPLIVDYFEEEMSTTLIDRPGNQWQGERRHGRSCHCHLQYSTLSQGYCENRGTPQLNLRKKNYRFLKQVQVSFCTKGRGGVIHIRDLPPSGPPSQTSSSQSSSIFHTRRVEWDWYYNFLER